MSNAMECRKELGEEFAKKHNIKLGFMSFFIKAAANALKAQPIVNAGK
jgi:Pyruvate/2-oxoglutarate dehydrogenase complex, dihydrolipoamide acyltransferase (E2) component, and related enzymes